MKNILNLEKLRIKNNLKQKDIANILNVKENTYTKWELEINDMPLEKFNDLANYYGVSLDHLAGLNTTTKITNKNINYPILYERLLKLRKDNNLSQEELANNIGTNQRAYAYYEKGKRPLNVFKLYRLATFYKVSLDYLVGRI